jgi:hypothetical protein
VHSSPSDGMPRAHRKSRESSPNIGFLEVRPKATKSRRTGKDIRSSGDQSSTADFASAFSDLADFGGFNSSPASVGAEARPDSPPWGAFPDLGDTTNLSDFVSSQSPVSSSSAASKKPAEEVPAVPADTATASKYCDPQASPEAWPDNSSASGSPARHRSNSVPIPAPFPRTSPAAQHLSKRGCSAMRLRAHTDSPASTNLVDPWGKAYSPGVHNMNLVDPWGYKYVK